MRPIDKTPKRASMAGTYEGNRRLLVDTIGCYCAYCEAPLTVDTPVEHKAAKKNNEASEYVKIGEYYDGDNGIDSKVGGIDGFPDHAEQWRNLLIACSTCNSAKGARPNRQSAREFLKKYNPALAGTVIAEQLFLAAIESQIWPDKCPPEGGPSVLAGDETLQLLSYVYDSRIPENLVTDGYMRLRQSDRNKPWLKIPQNKVWVVPNDSYIKTLPSHEQDKFYTRVKNTLTCMNLNYCNTEDRGANDRRVENRTTAWERAAAALQNLGKLVDSCLGLSEDDRDRHMLKGITAIRELALATGYWSVWWTVFHDTMCRDSVPLPWSHVDQKKRCKWFNMLFLKYDGKEDGRSVFPGTDLKRAPLEPPPPPKP